RELLIRLGREPQPACGGGPVLAANPRQPPLHGGLLIPESAVGEAIQAQPADRPIPVRFHPLAAPVIAQLTDGCAPKVDSPRDLLSGCPAQRTRTYRCQGYGSGRGKSSVKEEIAADFDPIAMQGVAVFVAAGQPGVAADELPGDVRAQQAHRAG